MKRKPYEEEDFIRIRNFLQQTSKDAPENKNWLIDRWIFGRYFHQVMHSSFDSWPQSVGLWEDESGKIVAVVHSEGNKLGSDVGEAFFQLNKTEYSDELYLELIEYAEKTLHAIIENQSMINLRVNEDAYHLKNILENRGYKLLGLDEPISSLPISKEYDYNLPDGFRIADAAEMDDSSKGFAHGLAFGYYQVSVPDDDDAERCYKSLRTAPNYLTELDVAILNDNDEIAVFATGWYDDVNMIGILEPLGTVPKFRRMGLATMMVYELINRMKKMGAKRLYVGSDQQFYFSLGFSLDYVKEIWQKIL